MKVENIDIFSLINERLVNLEEVDEHYYSKRLMYKEFNFNQQHVEEVVEMLARIQYMLTKNPEKYYTLLNKKLLDAQDAIIKACEKLYSERIRFNPELQVLVQNTIVPYYLGRFEMNLSREISFLPLELRLYIYTNILSLESETYQQMHLMNRIAMTLHKADETFLGDCAIFISAWLKSKISPNVLGYDLSFTECLKAEKAIIQPAGEMRKRILREAEMTPEEAASEFWYGFKGFSDLNAIHNIEAAKICFELFCSYFERSFELCKELRPAVLKFYKTKKDKEIRKIIESQGLNEVEVRKRFVSFSYDDAKLSEFNTVQTEQYEQIQKAKVEKFLENSKENAYLFLNPKNKPASPEEFILPEKISREEAAVYLKKLEGILRRRRISLSEFNEYLLHLTTAIMDSKDWEIKAQSLIVNGLFELYRLVWMRDAKYRRDIFSLLNTLIKILNDDSKIYHIGKGWPVCLIIEDSRRAEDNHCIVFYSKSKSYPIFAGHFYISVNPIFIDLDYLTKKVRRVSSVHWYWERVEKALNPPRSIKRKRHQYWKRVLNARAEVLED